MSLSANLQEHLPLSESTALILMSLAAGPSHGYAILKDVAEMSEGRVQLSTGTLYGALARLLELGWIERVESTELDESARPRKEYILTQIGRRVLNLELERFRSLLKAAQPRVVGGDV
ncbi:MAG: helix-turn-helix transcriptional regulator [Anaerolineae bacterium]|nr:helix-turn-helix transcriptional regulator [Anaerolineae bacterium]